MGENEEESQELAEAQTCDGHWKCLRCGEVRWPVGALVGVGWGGDETRRRISMDFPEKEK
jgi:hypothetical protein